MVIIGNKSFTMTDSEWVQAKTWILNDQQEKAMRWWFTEGVVIALKRRLAKNGIAIKNFVYTKDDDE